MYRSLFLSVSLAFIIGLPQQANANIFEDTWGIFTDPFKVGSGAEDILNSVDRAKIHADRIIDKVDASAERHLLKIESILEATRTDITNLTFNTIRDIENLERQFYKDTQNLILCTTPIAGHQIKTDLADSLNSIGEPKLKLFGATIFKGEWKPKDVKSPIEAFEVVKKSYDKKLSNMTGQEPATELLNAYAEIVRLSDIARCHYRAQLEVHERLYFYNLEYTRKSQAWTGRVSLN